MTHIYINMERKGREREKEGGAGEGSLKEGVTEERKSEREKEGGR